MTSILTNNGAMVALQTLKSINSNLADTQNQISTGKDVSSAKDNSAVWAISKVMEADVSGFKAISDSLSLGESTVAVGRNAAETTTDLLTEIKNKITSSQEANVDRGKIQGDISALTDQIEAVVGAAQFNGLNLIDGSAASPVKVMASLDRASDGSVTTRTIDVNAQNLSQTAATAGGLGGADPTTAATVAAGATEVVATFTSTDANAVDAGRTFQGGIAGMSADVTYVAGEGDSLNDVNKEMALRLNVQAAKDGLDVSFAVNDSGDIEMTNNTDADIAVAAADFAEALDNGTESDGVAGGKLDMLAGIDVSTENGAKAAMVAVEGLIQNSIDAAASFGSVENRISIQNDFVGKLSDSMKAGIGSLVDANMEEASAKLKALQTQQQLGVQSLSIANQAPGAIMSLFR
ncbi:flagellin [uncultured Jannaschia sp.]|uniref:flagellin N-terminal helical domain-containing protein n=1 Tax=uncultured Jannaschia sp. TaxID=293347 RepID=UPI0026114DC6|nr:flagellin [uncultured Jannaschia sp.]